MKIWRIIAWPIVGLFWIFKGIIFVALIPVWAVVQLMNAVDEICGEIDL